MKKRIPFINMACVLILSMAISILGQQPMIAAAGDTTDLSLAISSTYEGRNIEGIQYDLYFIGYMRGNDVVAEEKYEKYDIDFNLSLKSSEQWKTDAETLAVYLQRDGLAADCSKVSDENGEVLFEEKVDRLKEGLYLVVGRETASRRTVYYSVEPVFVLLPGRLDGGTPYHNVKLNAKIEGLSLEEDISLAVRKIWKDGESKDRPKEIEVDLLKDGEVCDTIKLNIDNNWYYEWTDLPMTSEWTAVEKTVPENYTMRIEKKGQEVRIVNERKETPPPPKETLPQTGQLWFPVPILLLAGTGCCLIGLRKKRQNEEKKKEM